MKIDVRIKSVAIQECLAHNYDEDVNYQMIYRVKSALSVDSLGAHRFVFQLLSEYIFLLTEIDSEDHFHLKFNAFDDNFLRCFICSSALRRIYANCRRYLIVNDIFLTDKFSLTLLLTIDIDVNNEMIIVV